MPRRLLARAFLTASHAVAGARRALATRSGLRSARPVGRSARSSERARAMPSNSSCPPCAPGARPELEHAIARRASTSGSCSMTSADVARGAPARASHRRAAARRSDAGPRSARRDEERAGERAAERRGERDALRFAARERARRPIEREVAEPHPLEVAEPRRRARAARALLARCRAASASRRARASPSSRPCHAARSSPPTR